MPVLYWDPSYINSSLLVFFYRLCCHLFRKAYLSVFWDKHNAQIFQFPNRWYYKQKYIDEFVGKLSILGRRKGFIQALNPSESNIQDHWGWPVRIFLGRLRTFKMMWSKKIKIWSVLSYIYIFSGSQLRKVLIFLTASQMDTLSYEENY